MKHLILTVLLFISFFFARANMDCIWTSHKAGITINYVAACKFENHVTVDSLLKIIVTALSKRDTTLKLLILINYRQLSFPGANLANFFSIGFDTLREIDNGYIFEYYWNLESIAMNKNGGLNTFRSKEAPIDINSTSNKRATKKVGIKIIYDIDYRVGKPNWNDLIKAIVYAAQNSDLIKKEQRRDTVRYNTNGWYVSLRTLDTLTINKIIGRRSQPKEKETVQENSIPNNNHWLFGILGLIVIGSIIYLLGRHNR